MPLSLVRRKSRRIQRVVDELARALQWPELTRREPVILEDQIAQTKSLHVVVIWDAWGDLPPGERSNVIRNAYAKAKRARDATITVAMGVTAEEALRTGLLPYSIITTRREDDKVMLDELTKAMEGAGGIVVKVGSSTQLRFPSLEHAEDAYRYLSQKVPGPFWAIAQELRSGE